MPIPPSIDVHFAQAKPPIRCQSIAEMDESLDRLHAASLEEQRSNSSVCPIQVCINFPGYSVSMGLGNDEVFLGVWIESTDIHYYALGDKQPDEEYKTFYGVYQDTYWTSEHLLPVAVARDAARYFVETQKFSSNIKWYC